MSSDSFWRRIGSAIGIQGNGRSGHPASSSPGTVTQPPTPRAATAEATAVEPRRAFTGAATLLPWRRPSVEQLQEGYQRVSRMLEAMQDHFERQDRRAEQMTESLTRVARTLEQLAEAQRSQGECIAAIATNVDAAGKHAGALSSALNQMPASLQAQAEAVRAIARQMEASQETDIQLVTSLQRFGVAVDALRESGAAQFDALQRLNERGADDKDALQAFIRDQNRRFLFALLGLGAVIVAGLSLATALLLRALAS